MKKFDLDLEVRRPQGDLNPCYQSESLVSWTELDDGDAHQTEVRTHGLYGKKSEVSIKSIAGYKSAI